MTLSAHSAAERRGLDLSSAPAGVQATLNRIMFLEDENRRLRSAIEEYRLWRPGEKGHAVAHRKLMEALR